MLGFNYVFNTFFEVDFDVWYFPWYVATSFVLLRVWQSMTLFAFSAANPSDYSVTCGEHQLNVEESFQVDLPVTEVKVHPNYKSAPDGFDIAVYKVTVVKMGPQCLDGLVAMDLWSGIVQ